MWRSLCCAMLGGTSHPRCSPSSWWIVILDKAIHMLKSIDTFGIFNGAQMPTFALVYMYFPSCAYGSFHLCSLLFFIFHFFISLMHFLSGLYERNIHNGCLSSMSFILLLQFANYKLFVFHCNVSCLFVLTIQSSFLCLCIILMLEDSLHDATNVHIYWEHTDNVTFVLQVKFVSNGVSYMGKLYKRRSCSSLLEVMYFKLTIEACCH